MIWRALGRILAVGFGFVAALGAGGAALIVIGGRWAAAEVSAGARGDEAFDAVTNLLGAVAFAFTIAPALTLLPALMVVIVGEVLRLRSALYYVAASGAAAGMMPVVAAPLDAAGPLLPHSQYVAIMATAGFAAGLVYWLVAGRNA